MPTPNSFRVTGETPSTIMNDNERKALQRLASNVFRRGRRGWETPSAEDIAFHTAAMLKQRNLATIQHGKGRDKLTLTELGREIAAEVASRRKKRAVAKARAERGETVQ